MTVKSRIVAGTIVILIAGAVGFAIYRHRERQRTAEDYRENLRLGKAGDPQAQDRLGNDYFYGVGFPQSFADAMTWYRKAAAQGNAHSEFAVGYMYATGTGVAQDYPEAMKWYRDSSVRGYARAADAVGSMYFYGQGTAKDIGAALQWYRKAADGGEVQAEDYIGSVYFYGEHVPRDYEEAARWYRKAAERGYPPAEYDLGFTYYHGYGVPRSLWQTRKWYRKAAFQGDAKTLRAISIGLSRTEIIFLLIKLVGGLLLMGVAFRQPLHDRAKRQSRRLRRITIAAGCLILIQAAAGWYGFSHREIWMLMFAPNVFTAAYRMLDVVVLVLCVLLVLPAKEDDCDSSDDVRDGLSAKEIPRF